MSVHSPNLESAQVNNSALRLSVFRRYLAGSFFAMNAQWMVRLTLGWLAWETTQSASFVGLIAFLYFGPTIVLGPLFGVVTDRVNIRRAALTLQILFMSYAVALLLMVNFGLLGQLALGLIALLAGIVMAAHSPVRMALVPRLVEREHVGSVVNLTNIAFNTARILGPALAGYLIAKLGVLVCLGITTAAYLPVIVALSTVQDLPAPQRSVEHPQFARELIEGLKEVTSDPVLRNVLATTALSAFFLRGLLETLPVMADGVFDRGAAGLGALSGAAGLGAVTGGLLLTRLPVANEKLRFLFLWGAGVCGVALMGAVGLSSYWPLALILVAGIALSTTVIGIICQTIVQLRVDDGMRGRVMSLWVTISLGPSALGGLVIGVVADIIEYQRTIMVISCMATGVLAVLIGGAVLRTRRARTSIKSLENDREDVGGE